MGKYFFKTWAFTTGAIIGMITSVVTLAQLGVKNAIIFDSMQYVFLLIMAIIIIRIEKIKLSEIEFKKPSVRILITGFVIVLIPFLVSLIVKLVSPNAEWIVNKLDWKILINIPLFAVTAFVEELFFRGVLIKVRPLDLKPIHKSMVSAMLFASFNLIAFEFSYILFAMLFLIGFTYCMMLMRSKNLWLNVIVNCGFNLGAVYFAAYNGSWIILTMALLLVIFSFPKVTNYIFNYTDES